MLRFPLLLAFLLGATPAFAQTTGNFGAGMPSQGDATCAQDPSGNCAPLKVDGAGALNITGSISASNPSVGTNNAAAPASSTEVGIIDAGGKLQGVSATNPLPISGTISATNPSVSASGAAVPASATFVGAKDLAGNLTAFTNVAGNLNMRLGEPGTEDAFGQVTIASRLPQIQVSFFTSPPATQINVTTSGGATATQANGAASFTSGAAGTADVTGITPSTVAYTAHYEVYAAWTAAFTTTTSANSFEKIGLYNATNGFYVGWSGLTFGSFSRVATVDTFTGRASWNTDLLTGAAGSKFTSAGAPVALDTTKLNVWRVRFGWLGAAPIAYEILSPDGVWVTFHQIRYPNTSTVPSITSPNLPITLDVNKAAADATSLTIVTGCWVAGVSGNNTTGFVDTNNTTLTALGGGATFTGLPTDTLNFAQASIMIFSDQSSAANGVNFEFSQDGINWDDASVFAFTAGGAAPNAGQGWEVGPRGRFFRVVYTNGATPQTTFRLTTTLTRTTAVSDILDLGVVPTANTHALTTRAVISGKTTGGGGGFVDVKVTPSGTLTVAPGAENTIATANNGTLSQVGGNVTTAAPTYTNNTVNYLSLDTAGALRVAGSFSATGSTTPSDAFANPTNANLDYSLLAGWNGTTWDRVAIDATNSDADPVATTGALDVNAHPVVFNGTTFDRWRGGGTNADTISTLTLGVADTLAYNLGWNGTTWDRLKSTTANGLQVDVTRVTGSVTTVDGTVDAANTSSTPLGGAAAFTGTFTDASNYNGLEVQVFSNVSSAINGLSIQFSTDGVNADDSYTASFITGGTALVYQATIHAKFIRVVYTNGASAQGSFRLQTLYKTAASAGDVVEISDPIQSNAHGQVTRAMISDVGSNIATIFPAGQLRITDEPRSLMVDSFDVGASLDVTNRWNASVTGGTGVACAAAGGNLTCGSGTTANSFAGLTSQPLFSSTTPAWIRFAYNVSLEFPIVGTTYRSWGGATLVATPASTGCPACSSTNANGAVFELNTDGKMYAATYSGNTRTAVCDLSVAVANKCGGVACQPANNAPHNYEIYERPTTIYWFIDRTSTNDAPACIATLAQSLVNVDAVPASYLVVQAATTSTTLTSQTMSVSDEGKNNTMLSDGTFEFRKATVKAASAPAATADTSLVVQLNPAQPNLTTPLNVSAAQATAANLNATVVQGNAGTAAQSWFTKIVDSGGSTTASVMANDTTAALNGLETQPAIARATPTAVTAARSEKLQVSTTNGGVFANITGGAGVLVADVQPVNTAATGNGVETMPATVRSAVQAGTAGRATDLSVDSVNGSLNVRITDSATYLSPGVVANDATAIANGLEVQPGVARAAPTAITAGRSEKLEQDATSGGLYTVSAPTTSAVGLTTKGIVTVTASQSVKASVGNLYGFAIVNGAGAGCWLQCVNSAGAGTLGTAVIFQVPIVASATVYQPPSNIPLGSFSTGIACGMASAVNGASACGTAATAIALYYQ